MITNQEEFDILRRNIAEEHRKDLEALAALERLQRFLPTSSVAAKVTEAHTPTAAPVIEKLVRGEEQSADSPYLIGAVLDTVLARPGVSFNPRMVFELLKAERFPFPGDERRSLISIGSALKKLTEREEPQIRLVRRGKGRQPNLYRALAHAINQANPIAAGSSELTM